MYRLTIFCLLFLSFSWALPPPRHYLKRYPLKTRDPRIVNGFPASLGQFPWQAALLLDDNRFTWFCGGSIISEQWILTAGHCVQGGYSGAIFTGSTSSLDGYISLPIQFILHEEYGYDGENLQNDIGLIRLLFPLPLDANTAAIRLSNETLTPGVQVTVSGYGLTSDSAQTISDTLNYVDLTIISNDECQLAYQVETIRDEMVCAISTTDLFRGTCNGDSGGGLVRNADTDPVHEAVVSFVSDDGCENGAPNGFTRTAYYREWIYRHTGI